jgi:hypothetical protein
MNQSITHSFTLISLLFRYIPKSYTRIAQYTHQLLTIILYLLFSLIYNLPNFQFISN